MGSRHLWRSGGGRFRRAPSLRELGWDVADGEHRCRACGELWRPVLKTGICPKCGAQDSEPVPPPAAPSEAG